MNSQLSMLDILDPPPAPPVRIDRPRYKVTGRAYGGPYDFTIYDGDPEPFELQVRGTTCTIGASFGLSTYVTDGPGSLFWSETGFRNFSVRSGWADQPDAIIEMIERFIDAPKKDGNGCGGKLVRWWPLWVRGWQSNLSWSLTYDRATMWDQWGEERRVEIWAAHDAKIAAAEARMWAEGIDPNDVGKPATHKGKWPIIERKTDL